MGKLSEQLQALNDELAEGHGITYSSGDFNDMANDARALEANQRTERDRENERLRQAWDSSEIGIRDGIGSYEAQKILLRLRQAWDAMHRRSSCWCQWEDGDSPCPIHGMDDE